MYSTTNLYYLNQMGIRPWIKRSGSLEQSDTVKQERLKLLVFISSTLSIKAKSLLQQMMSYINLCEQELTIIPVQNSDSLNNYHSRVGQKTPLAILVLGLNKNQLISDANFDCPILTSIDPDYLIANPAEKRKVFQDLNYIKQLIS